MRCLRCPLTRRPRQTVRIVSVCLLVDAGMSGGRMVDEESGEEKGVRADEPW